MDMLIQYAFFTLKALTIVIAILITTGGMLALSRKPKSKLEITPLNQRRQEIKLKLLKTVHNDKALKAEKKNKQKSKDHPVLFVIDFMGDLKALQAEQLREEISAALSIASSRDEILVRVESPGGTVNGYGFAASQLQRIRDQGIPLTVSIDKVAASGGYLMACVAHQIIAAPFAIVGSIGVVAQLPNFHRLLKKNNIDVELLTAGEYKRTLTMFAENTEKGRQKFLEDLEKIHDNFKYYVLNHRNNLNLEKISTGEHWLAKDALDLNLVDILKTSDEYINEKMNTHQVFKIQSHGKQSLMAKIFNPIAKLLSVWG